MKNRRNNYQLQGRSESPEGIVRASHRALTTLAPLADASLIPDRNCAFCGKPHSAQAADSPDAACDRCQSPLVAVIRHETSTETKRAFERMPHRMRVTCFEWTRPNEPIKMLTENISIHGALLSSPQELSPGQRLQIRCAFCDAVGVVTHVSVDFSGWRRRWRAGVQFLTLQFKQSRGVFLALEG